MPSYIYLFVALSKSLFINLNVATNRLNQDMLRGHKFSRKQSLCFVSSFQGYQSWWWRVRASRELFWGFRASTNDDHDGTRILRIQRIIRIFENFRIRCPDCGTREGSPSIRIRFIRCIRVLSSCGLVDPSTPRDLPTIS